MAVARVVKRELARIWAKPRYLTVVTLGVVVAAVFFVTLLWEGQPLDLPVAVVDHDGTYLSRRLTHELNATPAVKVIAVYPTFTEARKSMQRGEIYAFYEIPKGTYNDLLQFKSPHFGVYTNNAFLLGGSLSYKELATLGTLAAGAVQREVMRKQGLDEDEIMGLIQPLSFDYHQIGNPWASYLPYVAPPMLMGVVAYLTLLFTIYSIASENHERTWRSWLKKAAGRQPSAVSGQVLSAIIGKLIPYTLWFSMLGMTINLVLFGFIGCPMEGSWPLLCLITILMVMGAQCAGVMIAGCIPDRSLSMSVGALYGALSFTLAGFSFPVSSMLPAVQGLSLLYPLRHYYLAYVHIAIYGDGFAYMWPQIANLLGFGVALIVGVAMISRQLRRREKQSLGNGKEVTA